MGYQRILESCTLESALGLWDCCEKGRRSEGRWVGCARRDAVLKELEVRRQQQPWQVERRAIVARANPTVVETGPIWRDAMLSSL
jgi:hypothetical protein